MPDGTQFGTVENFHNDTGKMLLKYIPSRPYFHISLISNIVVLSVFNVNFKPFYYNLDNWENCNVFQKVYTCAFNFCFIRYRQQWRTLMIFQLVHLLKKNYDVTTNDQLSAYDHVIF